MSRLAVLFEVVVLLAGGCFAETQDCIPGAGQCAVDDDHALLATKIKMKHSKKLATKDTDSTGLGGILMEAHSSAREATEQRGIIRAMGKHPVSTSQRCVICIAVLYFVVWTSLFMIDSAQEYYGEKYEMYVILLDACDAVRFGPRISVLLIATEMRAIAITNGDPDEYGLPQWWCQTAMVVASACVFILTFCSIGEKLFPVAARALTVVQYFADTFLYVGCGIVAYGLYSMDHWELESIPVRHSARCVITLTLFCFVVAILHQIGRTIDLFNSIANAPQLAFGPSWSLVAGADIQDESALTKTMRAAQKALEFAPQICILFLAARMRAQQLGHRDPQEWARYMFFGATCAIVCDSGFVAYGAMVGGQKKALSFAAELISLMVLHVATVGVIVSVYNIEAKSGPTPFISTTVRVVMCLTVLYFFVHTCLFVSEQLYEAGILCTSGAVETFRASMESIMFVPMLCALVVGTRMRALQLSHNKGAPQGWAQDCMTLATWAIFADLLVVVFQHVCGCPGKRNVVGRTCQGVCLCIMHACTVAVIVSIFFQTVENTSTNGKGELIPGFKVLGRA